MHKTRLNIDDLNVESFASTDAPLQRVGTVRAYDSGTDFDGCVSYYSNCATCLEWCPADTMTCFGSCRMVGGQAEIDPNC